MFREVNLHELALPEARVSRSDLSRGTSLLLVNLHPFEHAATSGMVSPGITVWRAADGRVVSVGIDLVDPPPHAEPPD